MIWYRHWLEMRKGLLFMAGLWLFVGLTVTEPFNSLRVDSWHSFSDPLGQELTEMRLGQAIGDEVLVWAEFAGRILPFTLMATLVLAGSGLRSLLSVFDTSAIYTLTLPISRTRLVWTRLVAALGATVLAGLLVSAASSAILLARGYSVPLVPVAQSFALGVVCVATSLAVVGALVTSMRYWLALPTFMALFASTSMPISYIVAAPARGEAPWGLLAACVTITALAVTFTVNRASAREY